MAVLLWYQFGMSPYGSLSRNPANVNTVQGRTDTKLRCGADLTRPEWNVMVADDYCYAQPEPSARRLQAASAAAEDVMDDLGLEVCDWAAMPGQGKWVRIHTSTVLLAIEFYLSGFAVEDGIMLSNEKSPPFSCTDCAPTLTNINKPAVTFARFLEYEGVSSDKAAADCATIVGVTPMSALSKNVLSLRQQPVSQARQLSPPPPPTPPATSTTSLFLSSSSTPFPIRFHPLPPPPSRTPPQPNPPPRRAASTCSSGSRSSPTWACTSPPMWRTVLTGTPGWCSSAPSPSAARAAATTLACWRAARAWTGGKARSNARLPACSSA